MLTVHYILFILHGKSFLTKDCQVQCTYIMKNEYVILDLVREVPLPFWVLHWIRNYSSDMGWFQIETPSFTTYIPLNLISF